MILAITFLIVGLVLLVYSADFLVKGASNLAAAVGVSAMIIPLVVHAQLVRFDVPVMIGVSIFLYVLSMDGLISRVDGIVLFGNEKTPPRHFRSGD